MKRILAEVKDNGRLILFACGGALFYAGVSGFSQPAANIAAGALVMAIAAAPYVMRTKKG